MTETQGIVISTSAAGEESCRLLLKSICAIKYPVFIVVNDAHNLTKEWQKNIYYMTGEFGWHLYEQDIDGHEISALDAALSHTTWEEFILLEDSTIINDIVIFNILFDYPLNLVVQYDPYLVKYRRETVEV